MSGVQFPPGAPRYTRRKRHGRVHNSMWYLYIAQFSKTKLYTGISNNVARRIEQHNNGTGAKSLRGKGPVLLLYTEEFETGILAARREREIKGWNRDKKLDLINKVKGFTLSSG